MATVLSSRAMRAIERGIRAVLPHPYSECQGAARVVESNEFLTPEESEALLESIARPTPGAYLDMFIWEFADGSVKSFAAKVGYHPNRISALKASTVGISPRLFRRMAEAYKLDRKERDFWSKGLLGI